MFGRWLRPQADTDLGASSKAILELVRNELPAADEATWTVVTAMAGLLGAVAYADRSYTDEEERLVRAELRRIQGMSAAGIDAICAALRSHIVHVATTETPRYCRALLEFGDRELRFEILGLLVDVAAADGRISTVETNLLRQLTKALGLSQDDYTALQARHRERLSVLGH